MAYRQNIPKIIHQIWLGPDPRPKEWMETWEKTHPGWEYKLWTEANLPKLHNQKQFDLINNYPGKADILRVELLLHYGGVYIDADSECLHPLDDSLLRYHFFAGYENEIARPGLINNAVIGSEPNHPIIASMIDEIQKITELNDKLAWVKVGPILFTKVIRHYEITHAPVKIFPSHYFYPDHYTGSQHQGRGKVYAREHWHSTFIELNK